MVSDENKVKLTKQEAGRLGGLKRSAKKGFGTPETKALAAAGRRAQRKPCPICGVLVQSKPAMKVHHTFKHKEQTNAS